MIQKFQKWYEKRHEYAKEWKAANPDGKVLGYFCTYVPEEICYAANVLPVRILGSHQPQNVAEPHIFSVYCGFCRDVLAQGLQGRYDYLDGIVIGQSCLHVRQAYVSWDRHLKPDFSYYLCMPHNVQSQRSNSFLEGELRTFTRAIESWTGREVTETDLDRGIEIMNENRRLMKQVYETRKKDKPPMTGCEAMYMVVASQVTDKRDHSAVVREVLEEELPRRDLNLGSDIRLMLIGGEGDDVECIKMIEEDITSNPATVVIDEHCTGSRYFWNEVAPQENRLAATAVRYIDRPPCPTKDWPQRRRLQHTMLLAKEWNIQGVVILQQKFCDPHELDIPEQKRSFEKQGIPTVTLETDITIPLGQLKIRTEAFLEMLARVDVF